MQNARATATDSRSTAVTIGAPTSSSEGSAHDSIFDRDSLDGEAGHPEWCVDTGEELKAMNKFELWLALGTGDVSRDVRVWKLGRERWQPAHEIPDLACALKLHADALRAAVEAGQSSQGTGLTPRPAEPVIAIEDAAHGVESPCDAPPFEARAEGDCDGAVMIPEACEDDVEGPLDAVTQSPPPAVPMCQAIASESPPSVEDREMSCHRTSEVSCVEARSLAPSAVDETDQKSVTPGPATVDTEDKSPIPTSVIRRKRSTLRKQLASPLSGLAALTALAATSLLTLPAAMGGGSASAAAHLPSMTDAFSLPSHAVAAAPAAEAAPTEPTPAPAEAQPGAGDTSILAKTDDAVPPTKVEAAVTKQAAPVRRRVRPSSVSPSHRGQGRKRQKSR